MIRVKNLKYSYDKKKYAVDDISFLVKKGEVFGFLGPNGAGKSTTQKILTGLLPIQEGKAHVAGMEVMGQRSRFFNKIGVSFEIANAYDKLTGLENLEYYAGLFDVDTLDCNELIKSVGLEDAKDVRVGNYSKGMKQRLIFARSMINNPEVWFLDEPVTGLDPSSSRDILDIIKRRNEEGTTILLTTHNMTVAEELCHRIAFMNNGRLIAVDTPRNLKLKYGEKRVRIEYRSDAEHGRTGDNDNIDYGKGSRGMNGDGSLISEDISLESEEGRKRIKELVDFGKIETIHSEEATLEDIFIELTGRRLV
ncbi:fluoroquinolone transport system ATP-binding protein [Dethiosulfatibacter aminovorans DSM 17477]|uniref:Fluoroquinolone transport system ATP-binding protein n=1 Tax=Dethiosulfatibacter aminovorans DSM 17477 TaxID=1121476 RepID=A0A1M6HBD3_9FIRM|nr:ABC transporter ATP-binding protein [Dethiosulfatibacter aminovorans]SHJ19434.1 fluoroquinolone transport system ATP-binding protein [Dethiosulfatibacter aminovorans DSM 17477]